MGIHLPACGSSILVLLTVPPETVVSSARAVVCLRHVVWLHRHEVERKRLSGELPVVACMEIVLGDNNIFQVAGVILLHIVAVTLAQFDRSTADRQALDDSLHQLGGGFAHELAEGHVVDLPGADARTSAL